VSEVIDLRMVYVKCQSELVARRMQVRTLRKIAKKLYLAILADDAWTQEEMEATKYYEKEMK
jgi:hypothetical protein